MITRDEVQKTIDYLRQLTRESDPEIEYAYYLERWGRDYLNQLLDFKSGWRDVKPELITFEDIKEYIEGLPQ